MISHSKPTRASSCTSFTAIELNSKTINDRRNLLEYYLKALSKHFKNKNAPKLDEKWKLYIYTCVPSKHAKFQNFHPISAWSLCTKVLPGYCCSMALLNVGTLSISAWSLSKSSLSKPVAFKWTLTIIQSNFLIWKNRQDNIKYHQILYVT